MDNHMVIGIRAKELVEIKHEFAPDTGWIVSEEIFVAGVAVMKRTNTTWTGLDIPGALYPNEFDYIESKGFNGRGFVEEIGFVSGCFGLMVGVGEYTVEEIQSRINEVRDALFNAFEKMFKVRIFFISDCHA